MSLLAEHGSAIVSEVESAHVELVDEAPFFAPVTSDVIDGLLGQYQAYRSRVERLALMVDTEHEAIHYFLAGNVDRRERYMPSVKALFDLKGAVAALNAAFWSKALGLTDVYDCMPQARRDEWNKSITDMTAPDFTEQAVRPTIEGLLAARQKFFAERVDGIFRGLSGEHVTNAPEAFGKRMIIARMHSEWGGYNQSNVGLINDLRCVIAKFMGRDEPKYYASQPLFNALKRDTGLWHSVDGGALRVRLYKKGTAHLEVHSDMAWRLNSVLASLYPLAIPAQFRKRPKKQPKEFVMMGRPLPFAVLELLPVRDRYSNQFRVARNGNTAAHAEAVRVIEAIGGAVDAAGLCSFDYKPDDVLREIALTGCIPDRVAHQFYPRPESIASVCAELAQIGDGHTVLEPSAGQGDLAAWLPKERTTCVEISALHCAILKARGFSAVQADFIEWSTAQPSGMIYDRVVMNPPFSEGRWKAHIEAAASMVSPAGRLVAVLPASARGKTLLAGFEHEWSRVFDGEFSGTTASVVVLVATHQATP